MAVSIVRGPDGRQHKVQHPDGIAPSQIIKYAQREIASVANAEDSFVVDVGKGLFTGGSQAAVSSAAGVTQWMGQSFGSDSLLQAAEDMRQYSQGIGDQVGLDEDFRESFFGQVVQGLGQVPVTIGAGAVGFAVAGPVGMYGAAALTTGGQMTSEFLTDMEQTIGKQYTDFNASEKDAALKGMLAQTALGTTLELAAVGKAVRPLLRRIKSGKGVSSKALKRAIEKDKGALREILESGAAEGFTEASQGQSLDTLASLLYDDDRELLTMNTLKRRSLEFGVGSIVGGTVSGGAQILGSPGKTNTTNKDLGKPVEGRSEVTVPRTIQVTYQPIDGKPTTVTLHPDEGESAGDAAERILEGRRIPGSDMTVNEVIEQTPIDVVLGETEEAVLEEDVPVDPAPTPAPTPIGDRRLEDNVAVEESDYILPDVELDDIARLDVGQLSDEELQKLIESYNKYNGEGDRVRNLDYLQDYAEIFNRELEGDLSEAEVQADIDKDNKKYNAERKRIARAIKERDARARGEASQLSEADFDALAEEAQRKRGRGRTQTPTQAPEGTETPIPSQRDYRNVKVGDTFEIVGVNGKTKQVEAIGISDESGVIRFKREDGTIGVTGQEIDSQFSDINSPDYVLQAAGHGTQNKSIKDLSAEELNSLEESINQAFDSGKVPKDPRIIPFHNHVADLNAIKLERSRRGQAPTAPTPTPTPAPDPSVETAPESDPFADPEPEVEAISFPTRQDFTISPRMSGSTPKWRGADVNYTSDLELAAYIASGKGKNAGSVRSELIEAGYSPAEIDAMGKDVRSQMRKQYNAGRPISVKISSDITAQASGVDRRTLSFKDVTKRTPEIQEQAKILKENIKSGDRQQSRKVAEVADEFKPVHPYDFVPAPETNSDMRTALKENQVPFLSAAVPDGKRVAMRLDIPAYRDYGTWVPVIHEPKGNSFQAGTKLSYQSTGVLENVQLGVAGKGIAALNIATGKDKGTIATIIGTYKNVTPTQAKKMADKALKDPSYIQVGMDPERRGYFYNRETMQEVVAGDQAIQVGPLVLVKNPVYGATPSNEYLSVGSETVGEDIVAQAAPFTAPQKAPLSHVEQSDIIDMDALIDDIVENDIPVWFWYADQLGEGDFNLPSGGSVNLDAGPSFALQPANRAAGRVWASSKSATAINNKISQLKYTDKNGKEQTGYIFLVSGSPDTMFLFNKQAFLTFYQNAFQEKQKDGTFELRDFSDVKKEILASRPTKVVKETLNNHSTLESLMNSAASRPFIEALLAQRDKSTPLAEYLKSKGFFDIENSQLRDGFYRDNNFKLNDVMLVVQPTKAVKEDIDHKTYATPVYGKVVGVPDKTVDAYLLMPDSVRKNKEITMDPPQAAQVVAPYGARVTTIKKIVGSQQARRAVKKLRKVIEDSPDGFTVDTAGEFATGGYIVAPDKATERVIDKKNFNEESLTQYIIDNKPHLNVEGAMLGGWYDSQNGRYVLDVVFAVDNEQDAVDIAIWGDQDAIFNLDTFTEIRTKDDNKNPTTPQGDTRTASEILSRKPTQNLGEYSSQRRRDSRGVRQAVPGQASPDVTAQAAETAAEDRGPQDTFDNINQLEDFISKSFSSIADKMGINIYPNMLGQFVAQYNVTQKIIEYNPRALLNRTKAGVQAAMREEIIHAAMHNVLIQKAKKAKDKRSEDALWVDFFTALGNNLTPQERAEIKAVYQSLQEGDTVGFGSEYSRAVVQKFRYGDFTEQYVSVDKGGPAFQAIVDLLRSVQAYMAKVLGPMVKTDPEAAQVIVDTVELLNAIDPAIRPKSQQVVANAYDATDKNTAEENTDPGESVDAKASERIREERKWFADSSLRKTASKFLTPVITRLNRINPMFGRMLQQLDTSIRERSFRHQKQTKAFFNKLNAIKGAEFLEMKQLLFFSPTPEEATHPINKAKMQRRDALLHKYGLLNMYRLDVQPIMEEIYAEYTKLGMPAMGYLEDYFPRVVKDLEGLINSYGQKSKRTFELLVREENERRSALKDKDGNDASLPEMNDTERARFFQDFLQNKFRVDINGARLPGNVKVRDIQLIPDDKLKFYDDPGIAFGKYTANMNRAIESFKVVGDTRKGKGSLQGELGKLTEELFSAGQIDNADADTVKSLTELITTQFQAENEILKSLGTLTYMATLINPGPVLVQIMDLYKVALYRGLGGVVSGVYRTVTGNRRFDLEDDLSISKTQLSAEFQDASVLQKALDFGLSRLVPFRQMDTAMKHASIEAAYDDFLKKAKSPVGSKKYNQLLSELTITMGRKDALETIEELKLNKAMESSLVKEALLAELLQRQPLTYLQVPEGYQTDPSKRLFYKLSTFMLLDLNYNRQEFMNDLGGPGKTLQQRTAALRRLTYMATLLTMFGLPSDMLDDWISGKDTYIPEHVMNNMLGMFGLSKYTTTRALEKGTVESVIQRFTPPAVNIIVKGEESLRSWVKGDVELFEMKAWRNSPLSDVWYNRTGAGKKQQEKLQKERLKEGVRPTFDR